MIRTALLIAILSLTLTVNAAAATGPTFSGDPQAVAEVQATFQKFASAHTWRARMSSSGGGSQGTQTMEHVAPDRFHMTFAQGSQTSEMFMIGHDAWMHAGAMCQKMSAAVPVTDPRAAMEQTDAKITVTRGGPETIEGTPTQSYMMTVDTQGRQIKEQVYVATATGLPRRVVTVSKGLTSAIDYFDYDAPITINNPPC